MRKFIIDLFFHIYLLKFSLLANVIKTPYPRSVESIQCQWSGNTKRKTSFQWKHHQGPSTYLYIYLSINAKHRHIQEALWFLRYCRIQETHHELVSDTPIILTLFLFRFYACCKHLLFLCFFVQSYASSILTSLFQTTKFSVTNLYVYIIHTSIMSESYYTLILFEQKNEKHCQRVNSIDNISSTLILFISDTNVCTYHSKYQ